MQVTKQAQRITLVQVRVSGINKLVGQKAPKTAKVFLILFSPESQIVNHLNQFLNFYF